MIEIENLNKSFGRLKVLENIRLTFKEPGIFAILGPNGSGKTTLIKSILGLTIPDHGDIKVLGQSIINQHSYRKNIAYLPQIARFPENLKVKELMAMVVDIREQKPVNQAEISQLFELEKYLDCKLRNLSGGTRQKVNILLSLIFDNPIIFLDEPTVGLDPVAMIHLKELIIAEKEKGKMIILTTHIMNVVEELADQIVFLLDGKIYFNGSLQEMADLTGEQKLERSIAQILRNKKKPDLSKQKKSLAWA